MTRMAEPQKNPCHPRYPWFKKTRMVFIRVIGVIRGSKSFGPLITSWLQRCVDVSGVKPDLHVCAWPKFAFFPIGSPIRSLRAR